MRLRAALRGLAGRLTLTGQVALLSLIPTVVLGVVLAQALQSRIVARTLADQGEAAQLIARIGIQPRLSPHDLRYGLDAQQIRGLDAQLRTGWVKQRLARIKIWNAQDTVVYSDDHSLIGRRLTPSDDLESALEGHPDPASIVVPRLGTETAGEVGLGTLVEVYVPLRFGDSRKPDGAFEMYLSYKPIAGAIASDKRTIAIVVGLGLAVLWLLIYPIVARASRRLRQQSWENYSLARYDQLTGLPNRTLFGERLQERMAERAGAVLVIDLDRFKQVNGTLGNATGDELLRAVAARLQEAVGEGELLARLGGDEFALFGAGDADAAIEGLAGRVRACLRDPVVLLGLDLDVDATVGAAWSGPGAIGAGELLARAETALARARASGRDIEVYSEQRDRFDPDQLLLLGQVRRAIERDELVLHYQPKLDLVQDRITAVEALVRWQHPERGLLRPMDFIPLVEPTALIGPLTLHLIERATGQLAAWRRRGVNLGVSVNLSARNLADSELPEKIAEILGRHDVPPSSLTVEVTESAAIVDAESAIQQLQRLRALGVKVSIDDFGTGNASISYLARLPAHEVKIDKSFVDGLCHDERASAVIAATVDIAGQLGMTIVAEGVETPEQLARLRELGCSYVQGYLVARPLPAEELESLVLPPGAAPWRDAGAAVAGSPPSSSQRPTARTRTTA